MGQAALPENLKWGKHSRNDVPSIREDLHGGEGDLDGPRKTQDHVLYNGTVVVSLKNRTDKQDRSSGMVHTKHRSIQALKKRQACLLELLNQLGSFHVDRNYILHCLLNTYRNDTISVIACPTLFVPEQKTPVKFSFAANPPHIPHTRVPVLNLEGTWQNTGKSEFHGPFTVALESTTEQHLQFSNKTSQGSMQKLCTAVLRAAWKLLYICIASNCRHNRLVTEAA